MLIPIGDLAIGADAASFTVCRRNTRKREGRVVVEWTAESWFPTIEGCIREIFRRRLLTSDAKSFQELIEHANAAFAELSSALQPDFQLIDKREMGRQGKELGGQIVTRHEIVKEVMNG